MSMYLEEFTTLDKVLDDYACDAVVARRKSLSLLQARGELGMRPTSLHFFSKQPTDWDLHTM
jgi:hypothetical protein